MTESQRVKLLRFAVNVGLPVSAFIMFETAVIAAGFFAWAFHQETGDLQRYQPVFLVIAGAAFFAGSWLVQSWCRERERLPKPDA